MTLGKEAYTHGHHESVLRSHTWRTAENSAAYLLDHLRPGLDLLDIGCGPGTITVDLAARVAPGRVVGLDAAKPIVEQARALNDSVEWRVGDAYTLDADLHDFHVVHAHQVLQHLADPVAALRAWGNACRQGGIVFINWVRRWRGRKDVRPENIRFSSVARPKQFKSQFHLRRIKICLN